MKKKKKTTPNKPNSLSYKKKEYLKVLEECHGIVSVACNNYGISRWTHYEWLKNDKWYVEQVEEINESVIDFVEGKLFERINGVLIGKRDKEGELLVYEVPPSDASINFFLKTRARRRGYQERQEVDHTTKGESLQIAERPIIITVEGIPKSISDQS